MIYCSNLCTEIAQNMQETESISTEIKTKDGETVVVTTTKPGDFVVCNLASLSLGHLSVEDKKYMKDIVGTAVRALDNVIDLNFYPVPYAQITNQKYRGIGLGVSGYHHLLAKKNILWESEEHLKFADELFEMINYLLFWQVRIWQKRKVLINFLKAVTGILAHILKSEITCQKNGKN